jgi:hypothetical protein
MDRRKIIALISITFICLLTYEAFEGQRFLNGKPQLLKHAVNFSLLSLAGAAGYYGLKKKPGNWSANYWMGLYAIVMAFLFTFGLADILFRLDNQNLRNMLAGVKMFFCSPLPFLLFLFLLKLSNGQTLQAQEP